jgi:hypothetical protein
MSITLTQILDLVGRLDDAPGDDTPRERFRQFLKTNVLEVGQLRDYLEECLRRTGDNYNRALQDLVNYAGHFLEFDVTFGRYQGVAGQIGFDGHWKSPTGFHIVVEVKTSEAFAIPTTPLVGYIDALISDQQIPNWDQALGLYVLGRPDPDIRQLENAIVAEGRSSHLRIISVDSLLTLAEVMSGYDIGHEEVLNVLRPSGPRVDPIVNLITTLVAQDTTPSPQPEAPEGTPTLLREASAPPLESESAYWITSVKATPEETAEECIHTLVGQERIYAFGPKTPGRKSIKPGDWICFYASGGIGVVAHAQVASIPKNKPHPRVRQSDKFPWVFRLRSATLYLDEPTVIDATLRTQLDAFAEKDPDSPWAWFVQSTHTLTQHDFHILTRQKT